MVFQATGKIDYIYDATKRSFTYEYFLKDHLGNTRAVVSEDASGNLVPGQTTSYYPFGMAFTGTGQGGNAGSDNKYLYNGKEKQDDVLGGVALDWYDYGARFYDPEIGRWHSIDPLAEKERKLSPYAYGIDEPIRHIDPDGCQVGELDAAAAYGLYELFTAASVATAVTYSSYVVGTNLFHAYQAV